MNSTNATNVFIISCAGDGGQKFVHKFPSQFTFVNHVTACFFSVLIMSTTITLNSLTFATFWSSPGMRKSISLFLVMILSAVDVVGGLVSNSLFTIRLASEIFGTTKCWMVFTQTRSSMAIIATSLATVTTVNIERYIGVVHPMYHRTMLQKRTLLKFLMLSWIVCTIILGLSFYRYTILVGFTTVNVWVFMLSTLFAYTSIGIKVIISERQRKKLSPPSGNDQHLRKEKLQGFLKELKFVKSCFMVVNCYVLCFTPVTIFLGVKHYGLSDSNFAIAVAWCLNFAQLSGTLNSFIFFWRSKKLRRETISFVKRIIQCKKYQND